MSTVALPAGWTLAAFDAIASTNDEAMQRADDGAAEGTVVWARQQLAGRGRRGRNWQSPLGNMYASVIVRPDCPPDQAAQLSFVTAIAVGETVSGVIPALGTITYKWPNDVQVDGGKIAGILLESAPRADGKVAYVVIGTGINVTLQPAAGDTPYAATSLKALGATASVEQALEQYCRHLAHWIEVWRRDGFAAIRTAWLARAGNLGQLIEVKAGQETCRGRFTQLDEAGALILETESGTRRITAGEIFRRSLKDATMLLVIDVGNTNSKFALFKGDVLQGEWRLQTQHNRTADEYAVSLTQLMKLKGIEPSDVRGAIIATVVPQALFNLRLLCQHYFKVEPLVVGEPGVDLGIKVLIDRPAEAGADRLVAAVAGHKMFGGPLISIDFGSATTFDIVDEDGNFFGGVLAPGIQLSIEAFYLMTARLPRIKVEKTEKVIGKGTVSAMQSGIFWGYVGLIEKLVTMIKAEYGKPMKVIATGGLAPLFLEATNVIDETVPDLILRGLLEIWRRNRPDA